MFQGQFKQVHPLLRDPRFRIRDRDANAPDAIVGRSFNECSVARLKERVAEYRVLAELELGPFADSVESLLLPQLIVPRFNLSTQFLGIFRSFGRQDVGERDRIAHEARLRCHHVLFGRAVRGTLVLERDVKVL